VESLTLCLALVASIASTGPAKAGHYRNEAQTHLADARDAGLDSPQTIVELDTGKLKGDPGMLAWAPDGKALYLQMIERDRKGAVTSTKHYVVAVAEKTITSVESQPAWVGPYWGWKAAPSSRQSFPSRDVFENDCCFAELRGRR